MFGLNSVIRGLSKEMNTKAAAVFISRVLNTGNQSSWLRFSWFSSVPSGEL
jgi:hypothetical protein